MRYTFSIILLAVIFISCNKDKFTTAPQITFKETTPDTYKRNTVSTSSNFPVFKLTVTDTEGDLGQLLGVDTSFVYVKNKKSTIIDSFPFPNISSIASKKFEAQFEVNAKQFLFSLSMPVKDTLIYEIFIKDFAGNKSNVVDSKPIYYFP
jgi:hypothetical protein